MDARRAQDLWAKYDVLVGEAPENEKRLLQAMRYQTEFLHMHLADLSQATGRLAVATAALADELKARGK